MGTIEVETAFLRHPGIAEAGVTQAANETPPVFREMAQWLAAKLSVPAERVPGGHGSCIERPKEVGEVVRPFLQRVTENVG